jgi:hypothetical protein
VDEALETRSDGIGSGLQFFVFYAFSSREPASTSLENAMFVRQNGITALDLPASLS